MPNGTARPSRGSGLIKRAAILLRLLFALMLGVWVIGNPAKAQKADDNGPVGMVDTLQLATLYWPPYVGPELPGLGLSSMIVRNALRSKGITFLPIFYPWRRVTSSFENDPGIIGYFPEYRTPALEKRYLFSEPIGYSPLGFAYVTDNGFDWQETDDLARFDLGVVAGYVNETSFDTMIERGLLSVVEANDDHTLLRLLVAGRLDAAVIDQQVMQYLMGTKHDLAQHAGRVVFHPKHLDRKSLHVVFPRSNAGERALKALNAGLKRFDATQ